MPAISENAAAPTMPGGSGGQPVPRQEARSKVTGQPIYAADLPLPVDAPLAYGYLVMSSIARGRIRHMNLEAAKALSGVLEILTHENAGHIPALETFMSGGQGVTSVAPLDDKIYHAGQIIGMVVAEDFETAREASYLIKVDYDEEPAAGSFDSPHAEYLRGQEARSDEHEDANIGDVEGALMAAAAVVDRRYSTETQHHNPIELHSTTAIWIGDELVIHEPSQYYYALREATATQMRMPREKVRVRAPFVGGAFGCKAMVSHRTALTAYAAKRLGRPVRTTATRDQGFTIATHRSETRHHVRLGADHTGRLTGYHHDIWEVTSRKDIYANDGVEGLVCLYGPENIANTSWVVRADRDTPGFMRCPHAVPPMFALESAMDELAYKLGIDPVELRKRNEAHRNPISGIPYTANSLNRCLDVGAKRFGWARRNPKLRSMREGEWLIGYGVASCYYPVHMFSNVATLTVTADACARYETAVSDVGQGAATILSQVVAMRLGLPVTSVETFVGDTAFPPGVHAGASMTTPSAPNTAILAADKVLAKLGLSPGGKGDDRDGTIRMKEAFARLGVDKITEQAAWSPPGSKKDAIENTYKAKGVKDMSEVKTGSHRSFAWGCNFVEVRIHERTREIRVSRMMGAYTAGYIVNPRLARSQLIGSMIWGIGGAMLEATVLDEKRVRYVNNDLAEYEIAVNADINEIEAFLLPEENSDFNMLNTKGLGEMGNAGTAAAIANAVYHATGKRITDLPINLSKMFDDETL